MPGRRATGIERAWERHLGHYPGDWAVASAVLLLVAAGSAAGGIVARQDGGAGGARTVVATSPVVPAPVAPPAATTASRRPAPSPKPVRAAPKAGDELAIWPARNGYTVVLASIPVRGTGLADATAKAKQALGRRVGNVGVLTSADFASLHPGYYVVFAGVYPSLGDAQVAARRLSGRYPNAYARQIAR